MRHFFSENVRASGRKNVSEWETERRRRSGARIFSRLSLPQLVFPVNSHFEVEGLRTETGISPNQPHTPSLSVNINTSP